MDGVKVGFNAGPKASIELGISARVGGLHLCLGVAAVQPQLHQTFADPQQVYPWGFVKGNSANRVDGTVSSVGL
jgi:hypothetical protein